MHTPLQDYSIELNYKLTIKCLAIISKCITEDYPLNREISNHEVFLTRLSKTSFKKLSSNIKKAIKLLSKVDKVEPTKKDFKYLAKKIKECHEQLTAHNLEDYKNCDYTWKYASTALHYLLDSIHHILVRFTLSNPQAIYTCKWCQRRIPISWKKLFSSIVFDEIPRAYLYLSLAQSEKQNVNYSEEEIITQATENIKSLFKDCVL